MFNQVGWDKLGKGTQHILLMVFVVLILVYSGLNGRDIQLNSMPLPIPVSS